MDGASNRKSFIPLPDTFYAFDDVVLNPKVFFLISATEKCALTKITSFCSGSIFPE